MALWENKFHFYRLLYYFYYRQLKQFLREMIAKILTYYTSLLNESLSLRHNQPEGVATLGVIGSSSAERANKMVVSLLNLERETAGGIAPQSQISGHNHIVKAPALFLNINVMMAAEYEDKSYSKSLVVLSDTLAFIQSRSSFSYLGTSYTVELVPLSTMDLHNIWTTMGGHYFPSVVCKIRRLVIDAGEITSSSGRVGSYEL